jgi:hypothetical protein
MPLAISRSAMVRPSALAPSTLPPRVAPAEGRLQRGSVLAAEATVVPARSSMTCA